MGMNISSKSQSWSRIYRSAFCFTCFGGKSFEKSGRRVSKPKTSAILGKSFTSIFLNEQAGTCCSTRRDYDHSTRYFLFEPPKAQLCREDQTTAQLRSHSLLHKNDVKPAWLPPSITALRWWSMELEVGPFNWQREASLVD